MSVSIRLNRKGTKDRPYYKIVAVDSRKRRDGRYIEQLGTYDPLLEGTNFTIDLAIADKWLAVGAKPSETVNSMIRKARTAPKRHKVRWRYSSPSQTARAEEAANHDVAGWNGGLGDGVDH